MAAQAFLRTVAKVVGAEVFDDAIAFFQAFEGMEEGFQERADAVLDAARPTTTPRSCSSPRPGATPSRRPRFFADQARPRPTSRCGPSS